MLHLLCWATCINLLYFTIVSSLVKSHGLNPRLHRRFASFISPTLHSQFHSRLISNSSITLSHQYHLISISSTLHSHFYPIRHRIPSILFTPHLHASFPFSSNPINIIQRFIPIYLIPLISIIFIQYTTVSHHTSSPHFIPIFIQFATLSPLISTLHSHFHPRLNPHLIIIIHTYLIYLSKKKKKTNLPRGRILYILFDFLPSHTSPTKRLNALSNSIQKFRGAIALNPQNADALFNLAQALATQAELLQDTDEGNEQAAMVLQEAVGIFENVYKAQEKELKEQEELNSQAEAQGMGAGKGQSGADDIMEIDSVASVDQSPPNSRTDSTADSNSILDDETTVTEILPITPYTLIDTLISTASALTSLAFLVDSLPSATDLYASAISKLELAQQLLPAPSSPDDMTTLADNDAKLCEIELAHASTLSSLADRTLQETGRVDHAAYTSGLAKLDAVLARAPRNVEALCDRGDLLSSYAQAVAQSPAPTPDDPSAPEEDMPAKQAWQLLSAATQSFTAAKHCEPRNAGILLKLGDMNLARARLPLIVATRNLAQLLRNAEFFYRQAVELDREDLEGGWVCLAQAVWLQGKGEEAVEGKMVEAKKVLKGWRRRGGDADMLRRVGADNEVMEGEFIEWAVGVLLEGEGTEAEEEKEEKNNM